MLSFSLRMLVASLAHAQSVRQDQILVALVAFVTTSFDALLLLQRGDLDAVQDVLDCQPQVIDTQDREGRTALIAAAEHE